MKRSAFLSIAAAVLMCCGIAQAWTTPQPVSLVNTSNTEGYPFISFDGRTLYFTRNISSHDNIYQATRENPSGPFTSVSAALNHGSAWHVTGAWVSQDNLRMYYHEESSSWSMKVTSRASVNDPWTAGAVIPGLSSFPSPITPKLTQNELTVVFHAYNVAGGMGAGDLWMATRPNISSPFGNIRNLSEINSSSNDGGASLSPNGLAIYFGSDRNGVYQIFKATRQSLNDPFGNPEHLSFFDTPYGSASPSLSADGSTLFFGKANSDGTGDIYFSEVPEPATLLLLGLGGLILRKKR